MLTASPAMPQECPPAPRLDRAAIAEILASGRRLLVQGGMGIHASDGVAGKVAAHRGARLVGVGTISAVVKTPDHLRAEIRRAMLDAPGGYVGVNLMAAINKVDFEALARVSIEERVSFVVQGAGISREIVRWCREGGVPFAGIVSSGGVDASDVARFLAGGAAGVQMATRFLACSDGDVHPRFKEMHLGKGAEDVTLITSCVKGMKARAVRNAFTERLARGEAVPPRSKAWFYGKDGYRGRRKACIECLAESVCLCRASGYRESFCITDALLAAAVHGDVENGLFYTGQSLVRIGERTLAELPSVAEILASLEERLLETPARVASPALGEATA
jgi:nitronate monooxygenase